MISAAQQEILGKLASLYELAPGIRAGQLLAHLDFLAQDMFDRTLGDIEDDQLLLVLQRHEAELSRRKSNVA